MDSAGLSEDPAADQLFDEIMARVYAIGELAPAARFVGAPARAHRAVADGARDAVRALRQDPTADVIHKLRLLLWSCGGAPARDDPWWRTPLGELLADTCQHDSPLGQVADADERHPAVAKLTSSVA